MLGNLLWIDGRNDRMKWWLINIAIFALMMIAARILFDFSPENIAAMKQGSGFVLAKFFASFLVFLALMLLFGWISMMNDIRRLHDLDKSGWWSLAYAAPALMLGFLLKVYGKDIGTSGAPIGILVFLLFAASVWRLVELGFFSGLAGDNDFGAPSGLSGEIDLDNEIEGMRKSSGKFQPDSEYASILPGNYAVAPAVNAISAAPAMARASFGQAPAGGGAFGKRR
jgi:uncharacterized membrane protein YhaH (DUF805 family)